jgi:C1A family cysteine protease
VRLTGKTSVSADGGSAPRKRRVGGAAAFVACALLTVLLLQGTALGETGTGSGSGFSVAPLSPAFLESLTDEGTGAQVTEASVSDDQVLGERPSPQDLSFSTGMEVASSRVGAPATYDLNALGLVTSVKDQGSYPSCWAFASLGSLESCLLPDETRNFSEDNMVLNCGYDNGGTPYMTGNLAMATAYLVRWSGPVNETQDAYGDGFTPAGLTPGKHVQEVYWLPARGSATDNSSVKNAIMDYGAVYTTMYWNESPSYYKSTTKSYYYGGSAAINHAVLIVGWDDSYSAANFASAPGGDGAFIVKNSFGTDFGNSGYFYVSYYDTRLGRTYPMAVFDNADSVGNYDGVYQYDPLGDINGIGSGTTTGWLANVFTANTTASLTAVGFYTLSPGSSYEVYTGSSLATKTLRTTGAFAYMGYHTVALPSTVSITSGQPFVVVVKVTSSSGTIYPIACEYPIAGYSSAAASNPGESYVSANGTTWFDITTIDATMAEANVCLKAYTSPSGAGAPSITSLGPSSGPTAGGTSVVITGTGFTDVTSVTFGGTSALSYDVTSTTQITAVASEHAAGAVQVRVTTTAGASANTSADDYTYVAPTRYEQSNSKLSYMGTWYTNNTATLASGGSFKYTDSPGSWLTVKFTGTYLAWINKTSSLYGIAKVTVDAGDPEWVDLYSAGELWKQKVWDTGTLTYGTHTVTIEWTGTMNESATASNIGVDAFDVVGTLVQAPLRTRYEQNNTLLSFLGTWTGNVSSGYASGGSFRYADSYGAYLTVKFTGSYLAWITKTSPAYGIANVTLDGTDMGTVDLYSAGELWKQTVWETGPLAWGTHTVIIEWTGTKNGSATATNIGVDAFDLIGALVQAPLPTRYEQNNALLTYLGTWYTNSSAASASGGSFRYADSAWASATVTFTGTHIAWVTKRGPVYGEAKVTVDEGTPTTVDLYSAGDLWKQKVWESGRLAFGSHTVTIEWTGDKNTSATGTYIGVDALDIVGTLTQAPTPTRYQQTNADLVYAGTWYNNNAAPAASGGSFKYSNASGASVTVNFNGTYLAWITKKSAAYGIAQVTLDATDMGTVDLYNATEVWQQSVWSTGILASGPHTLVVEWTGDKNASATGTNIGVDAFDIIGTLD